MGSAQVFGQHLYPGLLTLPLLTLTWARISVDRYCNDVDRYLCRYPHVFVDIAAVLTLCDLDPGKENDQC